MFRLFYLLMVVLTFGLAYLAVSSGTSAQTPKKGVAPKIMPPAEPGPQFVQQPQNGNNFPNGFDPNQQDLLKALQDAQRLQVEFIRSLPIKEMIKDLERATRNPFPPNPEFGVNGASKAPQANKGRLGARFVSVPESVSVAMDLPAGLGLWTIDVWPNSPAAMAGFKVNDLLIELAGKRVPTNHQEFMENVFTQIKADEEVDAVVYRRGVKVTLKGLKIPEKILEGPVQPLSIKVDPRDLLPPGVALPNPVPLNPAPPVAIPPEASVDVVPQFPGNYNVIRKIPGATVVKSKNGLTEIIPQK